MNTVTAGVLFGSFAILALLTVWSRRDSYARPLAVVMFFVGLFAMGIFYTESLGRHLHYAWARNLSPETDIRVLAYKALQDNAIWIYVDDPEREEPKPLVLPWSNEMADKVAKLAEESQRKGDNGEFLMRFEPSLDVNEPQFHPLPQAKVMPDKPFPPEPHFYGQ